jgi:hypothetical protein
MNQIYREVYAALRIECNCPTCKKKLTQVPYYTGRRITPNYPKSSKVKTASASINQYEDILLNIGTICINCGEKRDKFRKKLGNILFFIGISIFIPSMIVRIIEIGAGNIDAAIPLAFFGFVIGAIGLYLLIASQEFLNLSNPRFSKEKREEYLLDLFLKYIPEDKREEDGEICLSSSIMKNLMN